MGGSGGLQASYPLDTLPGPSGAPAGRHPRPQISWSTRRRSRLRLQGGVPADARVADGAPAATFHGMGLRPGAPG